MDNKPKEGQVISLNKIREEKIEEKRRVYERILFRNVLGAYCVVEGKVLRAVELVDVSSKGLSFQLPIHSKNLENLSEGRVLNLRFYFSEDTFFPVAIKIVNKRPSIEEGSSYIRFGCVVDESLHSYRSYLRFVEFLSAYAEDAQSDTNDVKLSYF